jgi:hypothetical protein
MDSPPLTPTNRSPTLRSSSIESSPVLYHRPHSPLTIRPDILYKVQKLSESVEDIISLLNIEIKVRTEADMFLYSEKEFFEDHFEVRSQVLENSSFSSDSVERYNEILIVFREHPVVRQLIDRMIIKL